MVLAYRGLIVHNISRVPYAMGEKHSLNKTTRIPTDTILNSYTNLKEIIRFHIHYTHKLTFCNINNL